MAKNKKTTINPKNKDDKCFQYALTVALNYVQIKKIFKEYQILNHLLINTTGKRYIFHHIEKKLSQKINQLLLTFCMCLIVLKK